MTVDKPGFIDNMTSAQYHADPCVTPSLSSSLAVTLVTKSPAHAFLEHPRLTQRIGDFESSDVMNFGSVVHELALGKGGGFAVWEGGDWRTSESKIFKLTAQSKGKTPIKKSDFDRAQKCVEAMRSQLEEMKLGYVLTEGKSEQVAVWKEGDQYARAMFDKWHPERNEIWDIKTTGKSVSPDWIRKAVASMNYDMRSEFYLRGASALTGIPARKGGLGYCFLFVETEPPFSVVPCYLDETFRERGRKRAQEAVDIWKRCMGSGEWPGYAKSVIEIAAPSWVAYELEDEESEIQIGGKVI